MFEFEPFNAISGFDDFDSSLHYAKNSATGRHGF